jgi:outer membrane protein insertion porin family
MYKTKSDVPTFLWSLILILLLGSCNSNKYLKGDQTWLKKNDFIFHEKTVKKDRNLVSELQAASLQKPNSSSFRRWIYYKLQDPGDTTSWDRFQRKNIAEVPVILDSMLSQRTASNLSNLMKNKGYINNKTDFTIRRKGKNSFVTYNFYPDTAYTIATIIFKTKDKNISPLIPQLEKNTLLKKGTAISKTIFDQEAIVITNTLRNKGFAYFNTNFITFDGDSLNHKVDLKINLLAPGDSLNHKIAYIGKVMVFPGIKEEAGELETITINGIEFNYSSGIKDIQPSVLVKAIDLVPGSVYSDEIYQSTQRNLNNLGVYSIINISPKQNANDPSKIDFEIFMKPNKRFNFGGEPGIFFSDGNNFLQNRLTLIGFRASANFRNKNAFHRGISFGGNFRFDTEFNLRQQNAINSIIVRPEFDFRFPRAKDYYGFFKNGKNLSSFSTIKFGLEYTSIVNIYTLQSWNVAIGDFVQTSPLSNWRLNYLGVTLQNYSIQPQFSPILDNNEFLRRSLVDQLFTGFIFKDLTYSYSSPVSSGRPSWSVLGNLETSGIEVLMAEGVVNSNKEIKEPLKLGNVDFAKFVKTEIDYRWNVPISKSLSSAFRFSTGLAIPLGQSSEIPFIKQFGVGGQNSIRAWQLRELGPGGYQEPADPNGNRLFFQTGDFKLEANAEFRFPIYWFLKGALFLDAGNIWTLDDRSREGSILSTKFVDQLAVGTGLGLRFDLSIFLIRFDIGQKIRYPYALDNGRQWDNPYAAGKNISNSLNYNLGLGLPF